MVSHRRKINCILSPSCLLPSIFFLYILLLCSCRVDCYDTLKQGQWITDNGTTLFSGGETFELGFFPPIRCSSLKRFVGIWYKWDPQTVVWVANRDHPVNGSTGVFFGIADDGNLQVWDINTGTVYWTSGVENSSSTNRTVKLMDSGNLVLSDDGDGQLATSLWESFKNPTDTFLPGMKMDENLTLISWAGNGEPGSGKFTFKQDQEGERNFTFKQDQEGERHYVISKKPKPVDYWRSWMSGNFLSSHKMPITIANLFLNFRSNSNSHVCEKYNSYRRCQDVSKSYERLVMNYTGELQYYLIRDVDNVNWDLTWREPEDECSIYNACGSFGSCNINNRPFVCKCLPGFHPTNPKNWHSQNFLGGCTRNSTSSDKSDTFLSLKMMKVGYPDSYFNVKNETECRKQCLSHRRCQAYSYEAAQNGTQGSDSTTGTDICGIWTSDLSNLQEEYTNSGSNLSVRVAKSAIESTVWSCEPCGTNMIPYPLSTGPNCGDPMYFSLSCNYSTGQVSFNTPNGTYRVTTINPSTQTFFVQAKYSNHSGMSRGILQLNDLLPFKETINQYGSGVEIEVEVSWDPPKEPTCTSPRDCKDWPNSTCNVTKDGKMKCLCTESFLWNGSNLNCTKDGDVTQPSEEPSKGNMSLTLIVMIPLIVAFVLVSGIICIYLWRRKMEMRQEKRRSDERNRVLLTLDSERHLKDLMGSSELRAEDENGIDVPFFDLESILAATDNFSDVNKLGQGGYGPVYKAIFSGGQEIAVKRLSTISGQGLEEFKNEVVLIAKLQHRNLVRLRGYCIKGHEKILLYEYMPNKSLDSFIFDQKLSMCLDWEMRFKIILGIARGLVYLHHDSRLRIIHRDLKTSNILLDEKMNPKISDFGLAKIVGGEETGANTNRLAGTYGYMSPEYAQNGIFSIKSDVFSFGVVLLEIISGKKNTGFYHSELAMSLLGYAWRLWVENKVLDLMDQTLREVCNANQFMKCVNIGLLCVQDDPNDRPTMSNVVIMLDSEATTVPTPKQPAFVPRAGPSSTASSSSRLDTYTESISSLGGR